LNSNDTFVLKTPTDAYLWIGKGASENEVLGCQSVALRVGAAAATVDPCCNEGEEPDDFFDALGGKAEYFSSPALEDSEAPLRLFECCDSTGNFVVEEVVGDFNQSDLNSDNVMILDAWTSVYVWIGKNASENEQKQAVKTASEYLNLDPSCRSCDTTAIIRVNEGHEPMSFSGFFQGWEDSQ